MENFRLYVGALELHCVWRLRTLQAFAPIPFAATVFWQIAGWPLVWIPGLAALLLTLLTLSEARVLRKVETFAKDWYRSIDVGKIPADELWAKTMLPQGPLGTPHVIHSLLPRWIRRLPRQGDP